jgi:hypothetical protein
MQKLLKGVTEYGLFLIKQRQLTMDSVAAYLVD